MKKKLSILLASVLIISSHATSFGASFADINDAPWAGAETYINAASSLGLMTGEESNGKAIFRAKDTVTLCETAKLVYNLLKETENATVSEDVVSKWTKIMSDSNIPSWSYTAVAYCLENSIVSDSSVSGFMDEEGKSKEASREDVAVMLGKALCLVDSSLSLDSTATKFKDNTKISPLAVQYITLLSNKHILSGDNNGNFNPKKTINRTEMAVLITKSYTVIEQRKADVFPAEGTAHAFVSEISTNAGGVTVTFFNGMPSTRYTIDGTVPISYEDGKVASYTDIARGQLLTISYNGDYLTNVVIGKTATNRDFRVANNDVVKSVEINYIDEENEMQFCKCFRYYDCYVDDGVNVTLDGESADVDDLIAVSKGTSGVSGTNGIDGYMDVILYGDLTMGDDGKVKDIDVTTKYAAEGEISKITTNKIELSDKGQYYLKDTPVNVILDNAVSSVNDLINAVDDGDIIHTRLIINKFHCVTEIEAATENVHEGTISYITSNKIMLTDGSCYYFNDDDNYVVDIGFGYNYNIESLIKAVNNGENVNVLFIIDGHGYVTEIWEAYEENEGTISCIKEAKGVIELTDGKHFSINYEDTAILLDGEVADFENLLDAVNNDATLYAKIISDSKNEIVKIYVTTRH